MSYAEVKWVIEILTDGAIDGDAAGGIVAFGGEHEVFEIVILEDSDVFGEFVDH